MQAKHSAALEGSAASPIPGTDENQNHHKVVSGYVNSLFFAGIKLFWVLLFFFNVPKASTKGQLFSKGINFNFFGRFEGTKIPFRNELAFTKAYKSICKSFKKRYHQNMALIE